MTSIVDSWWAPHRTRNNPARSRDAEIAAAKAVFASGVREVTFSGKRYDSGIEVGTIFRVTTADKKTVWVLIERGGYATTYATYRAANGQESRPARSSSRETSSEINARIKRSEEERQEQLASGRIAEEAQLLRQARYGTSAEERREARVALDRLHGA